MKRTLLSSLLLILLISSRAQVSYTGNTVSLVVSGTSTLHDWDMKSAKADCRAGFTLDANGQPSNLNSLSFSTPVNALKSEHTAMDNNAYKALKSDKNPTIAYTMTTASLITGSTTVKVTGRLTIAGTTKDEVIDAVCKTNPDNTITVTGTKKISMKDYDMQPPTFMMGTIKTGNDIVLKFTLVLRKA